MKRMLILGAILAIAGTTYGQIIWDKDTADIAQGFETKIDIETHNVATFTQPGTYRWIRTYNENCSIKTAICDKNSCYLETTDSADFTVAANESFDMICHFYPYNKCCPEGAEVSLFVFKVDDRNINNTATYILDLWCKSLGTHELSNTSFIVAPNPALDHISLLNLPSNLESIDIINLYGIVVDRVPVSSSIDVSGLKAGMYWIAIKQDEVEYKQRFIKQ
jgi:hypothetical protein